MLFKFYCFYLMFLTIFIILSSLSCVSISDSESESWFMHQYVIQSQRKFEQKTNNFWEYDDQSKSWVQVNLPYDLVSCFNDNCTKANRIIDQITKTIIQEPEQREIFTKVKDEESCSYSNLPLRKSFSLTKMSEISIWITGISGSIYERFWNGLQWVIAPHDLPLSAGYAVSVFIVNQTILALSESGNLYQLQLSNDQPVWIDITPPSDRQPSTEAEQSAVIQIVSGVVSNDRKRIYFCTKNGTLLELSEVDSLRWIDHGKPPGGNVAAIADASTFRSEVVFTISTSGDLYEYDERSRPSWKKHIRKESSAQNTSLKPSLGCSLQGVNGAVSKSLFLLTKGGYLIERRLQQRKWKWIDHGNPKDHILSSITCLSEVNLAENANSLFLTTAAGYIFEYRIPDHSGTEQVDDITESWINHVYPPHAKAARGIPGVQLQTGRIIFLLDDGRLGELHLSGLGGENSGPHYQVNARRKSSQKYVWSIIDAPETEGWNAEYCTEEHGPSNCIAGIKDETAEIDLTTSNARRRRSNKEQQSYISIDISAKKAAETEEEYNIPDKWINTNFRLRVMHEGKSFFLITNDGMIFENLNSENVWFWLRHDHSTAIRGALGNYNGSLFLVDEQRNLLIRERNGDELTWINCTAMRKGRQVIGGPPWDDLPVKIRKVTKEDALFFVSISGRLLQFTVALRKFKWKDCRYPGNEKIASIADQELLRENVVFVIGRNGRLYQYNKVTGLWHEHYQSQHLVLSKSPGTAMRLSSLSLQGSLFMLSEDGGLVEYQWNPFSNGWNWIEHGTPDPSVILVGSPGPCFKGAHLFLIGSDGKVYLRFLDNGTWKWRGCGFPYMKNKVEENEEHVSDPHDCKETCTYDDLAARLEKIEENLQALNKNCDSKVASTRPIALTEDSVIFELRDGRLAEMRRNGDTEWKWSRTIGTPNSLCISTFWATLAS
ncbi:PREDICTED: uncharacterized protein LOC109217097 isoform X1 [Nicotiana attenuata]|uniref:Uncharacterized protein n=1 Tax=Nicotiana attenuata TaxID=49451 RepID=A0A1J6K2E5_NICAT|nr:PREDICTED: uncharacterized protein LOC109217097 isoform X1 [Nicotiana attenuata]OIT22804.1 hypothetical protein A4A49_29961 [Nicotiana attenuata]